MRHLLVVANETVGGQTLIEAVKARAGEGVELVTVVCPINVPSEGYVIYDDTRRAASGRRLDRTLEALREAGVSAQGFVSEVGPLDSVRDALAQLEPPATELIVSTHPNPRSGWLRRNLVEQIRRAAGDLPVEHVVVELKPEEGATANVLVIANETVIGRPLLDSIRERSERSPAAFLIVSPQSDPGLSDHPEAERRLRRALSELRGRGIEAHGQIAHPDPHTAAMHAIRDERIDEIIVSTFPEQTGASWLRRDLVGRLRKDTGLPVEHVIVEPAEVGAVTA